MKRRGLGKVTDNRKWTEKILNVRKIGPEPPLNILGFWKKPAEKEKKNEQ